MPHAEVKALLRCNYGEEIHHIVEVVEGFAYAHEHHGCDFFAAFLSVFSRKVHLAEHFRGGEVPAKPCKG